MKQTSQIKSLRLVTYVVAGLAICAPQAEANIWESVKQKFHSLFSKDETNNSTHHADVVVSQEISEAEKHVEHKSAEPAKEPDNDGLSADQDVDGSVESLDDAADTADAEVADNTEATDSDNAEEAEPAADESSDDAAEPTEDESDKKVDA